MTTLKLEARALDMLRTACTFAAVDDCRYYINAVCIEVNATNCRVMATDSHAMFIGSISSYEGLELPKTELLLNAVQLKEVLAAFKAKRDLVALEITFDDAALEEEKKNNCIGETDINASFTAVYSVKPKEKGAPRSFEKKEAPKTALITLGRIVEYKRVIPIPDAATQPLSDQSLSPRLLEKISRAAISLNDSTLPALTFTTAGASSAVVTPLAPDAIAVVMPMRPGEYSYRSAYNKIF